LAEEQTAIHEAAHMVVAWEQGLAVTGATIVPAPEEEYRGRVLVPVEERVLRADWADEHEYLYAHLVAIYAGIAASEIYTGSLMSQAEVQMALEQYGSDYFRVGDFVLSLGGPEEAGQAALVERARGHARTLVTTQWDRIKRVADVLLERETLDEGGCRRVLEEQQ
jgi:ATP-dependent Zn protease